MGELVKGDSYVVRSGENNELRKSSRMREKRVQNCGNSFSEDECGMTLFSAIFFSGISLLSFPDLTSLYGNVYC